MKRVTATRRGITIGNITFKVQNTFLNILICSILSIFTKSKKPKQNPIIKSLQKQWKEKI